MPGTTAALEEGRLSVNVRPLAHDDGRRIATGALHQTPLTFLGATLAIGSLLVLRVLATILRPRR
jgi:hypothetical protein